MSKDPGSGGRCLSDRQQLRLSQTGILSKACLGKNQPVSLSATSLLRGPVSGIICAIHPNSVVHGLPAQSEHLGSRVTGASEEWFTFTCAGKSVLGTPSLQGRVTRTSNTLGKAQHASTFQNVHRDVLHKLLPPSPVHGFGGPFLYFKFAQTSCEVHHCHCYDLWLPLQ